MRDRAPCASHRDLRRVRIADFASAEGHLPRPAAYRSSLGPVDAIPDFRWRVGKSALAALVEQTTVERINRLIGGFDGGEKKLAGLLLSMGHLAQSIELAAR